MSDIKVRRKTSRFFWFQKFCSNVSCPCVPLAKVYIDKKLKRNSAIAPDDLIGDILHQSRLSKKELYAAITELQIGGVETVSNSFDVNGYMLYRKFFMVIQTGTKKRVSLFWL